MVSVAKQIFRSLDESTGELAVRVHYTKSPPRADGKSVGPTSVTPETCCNAYLFSSTGVKLAYGGANRR
jgi:hypothetical protein